LDIYPRTEEEYVHDPRHTNARTDPFACVSLKYTRNRGVDNVHRHNPGR
jgi:hypothetical protein